MKSIELACDMTQADEFCAWLKSKFPLIDVRVGQTTGSYINGVRSAYSTYGDDLTELWNEFCGE